jgi:hypothetical protein
MSSNHDQAARTLLKPQPAIMIIETPRLFPIQTSAEVLAWRIGKRTARIGTKRNWNTAYVRYQILKPRKDSHESPIKSCTMSCKIKQRETWHCANSFPNSKAARWGSRNRILRFETQQVQTCNIDWDSRTLEKNLRDVKKETSITKQNRKFMCVREIEGEKDRTSTQEVVVPSQYTTRQNSNRIRRSNATVKRWW